MKPQFLKIAVFFIISKFHTFMKNFYILLLVLFSSYTSLNAQVLEKNNDAEKKEIVDATYPGGVQALVNFIGQNLEYPTQALISNIEGK